MPIVHADDFTIHTKCNAGVWEATVLKATDEPIEGVKAMTYKSPTRTTGPPIETLKTDSNGMVSIQPEQNMGHVKFSRGGYNPVMLSTACGALEGTYPEWVKTTAGFWAEGKISDQEYANSLSYLAKIGVITIPTPDDGTSKTDRQTCDDMFGFYVINALAHATLEVMGYSADGYTYTLPYGTENEQLWSISYGGKISKNAKQAAGDQFEQFVEADCAINGTKQELVKLIGDMQDLLNEEQDQNKSCRLFCDSTGYEPSWTKNMGEMQAGSKCMNLISTERGTKDRTWCSEFSGYLLDQMR